MTGVVTNSLTGNPIENVYVEVAAALSKAIDWDMTDADGVYSLSVPEDILKIGVTFTCSEYFPQTHEFDRPPRQFDTALVPVGVTRPRGAMAKSGPRSVYVSWRANPEYNLKGYYVWRTATDATGDPGGNETEKISELVSFPEFTDSDTTAGQYYVYQIQALSGGDRLSDVSEPSNPEKGQYLTVGVLADVTTHTDFGNLYLWDLTPEILDDPQWVRIPISAKSAYEVSSTAMDLVMDVPQDLLLANTGDELLVEPAGITAGMTVAYNFSEPGTVSIAASDTLARSLLGEGVLFNVYLQQRFLSGTGALQMVEDTYEPGSGTGREGVRVYDDSNPPERAACDLAHAQLTVNSSGTCIHGDVTQDQECGP